MRPHLWLLWLPLHAAAAALDVCDDSTPPVYVASYNVLVFQRNTPRAFDAVRRRAGTDADSPRTIHVAAAASPRFVSMEYRRRDRGVASTRVS